MSYHANSSHQIPKKLIGKLFKYPDHSLCQIAHCLVKSLENQWKNFNYRGPIGAVRDSSGQSRPSKPAESPSCGKRREVYVIGEYVTDWYSAVAKLFNVDTDYGHNLWISPIFLPNYVWEIFQAFVIRCGAHTPSRQIWKQFANSGILRFFLIFSRIITNRKPARMRFPLSSRIWL